MKRDSIFALVASAMLAVLAGLTTSCSDNNDNPAVDPGVPKAQTDALAFDENNVVLTFVGMSDIHIMIDPASSMKDIEDEIRSKGIGKALDYDTAKRHGGVLK